MLSTFTQSLNPLRLRDNPRDESDRWLDRTVWLEPAGVAAHAFQGARAGARYKVVGRAYAMHDHPRYTLQEVGRAGVYLERVCIWNMTPVTE